MAAPASSLSPAIPVAVGGDVPCGPPIPGTVELYTGPMFAGKTTSLIRRVSELQAAAAAAAAAAATATPAPASVHAGGEAPHCGAAESCVMVIKYGADVRYDESAVATHDGRRLPADAAVTRLADCAGAACGAAPVIAVDEGQFYPDLADFCAAQLGAGRTVLVSALSSDFRRRPFGPIAEMLERCGGRVRTVTLRARCSECGRPADWTRRLVDDARLELVGGSDLYMPACDACYAKPLCALRCATAVASHAEENTGAQQNDGAKEAAAQRGDSASTAAGASDASPSASPDAPGSETPDEVMATPATPLKTAAGADDGVIGTHRPNEWSPTAVAAVGGDHHHHHHTSRFDQ